MLDTEISSILFSVAVRILFGGLGLAPWNKIYYLPPFQSCTCSKLLSLRPCSPRLAYKRAMAATRAAAPVAVVQSPQDKRQYKRLRLDNGLDVLLIHDPEMADALEGHSDDNAEEDGFESDDEGEAEDEDEMEEDMADEVTSVSSWKPLTDADTILQHCTRNSWR